MRTLPIPLVVHHRADHVRLPGRADCVSMYPCSVVVDRGVTRDLGPSGYGDDGKPCGFDTVTCPGCIAATQRHAALCAHVRYGTSHPDAAGAA